MVSKHDGATHPISEIGKDLRKPLSLWAVILARVSYDFNSNWLPNYIVTLVFVLCGPAIGLLMSTPKSITIGVATGLTIAIWAAAFIIIRHASYDMQEKRIGTAGEWLHDQYIGLLVPEHTIGTLLSEEEYQITIVLENRTSMQMQVTLIDVEKYNPEAAVAFRSAKDLVHHASHNVRLNLGPHEKTTVSIIGNQILPKTAIARVFHTLSGEPSRFTIDLGGTRMPMPPPRHLSIEHIYRGIDGLSAITRAKAELHTWPSDTTIVAAFPGDNEVFIDTGDAQLSRRPSSPGQVLSALENATRLKFIVIKSWVVTFYSFSRKQYYTAVVDNDTVQGKEYSSKQLQEDDLHSVSLPRIGNQEALEIVNAKNLICADWDGPQLGTIKHNDKWVSAWFLQYRGPDSLPLVVDATTGALLIASDIY